MTDLIPIVTLALELGADPGQLAADLAADIRLDPVGIRTVSAELARGLVDAHNEKLAAEARRAAEQAERDRQRREQSRAETERLRARFRARGEAHRRILEANPNAAPAEVMCGADSSPAMARLSQATDEYLSGHPDRPLRYHKYSEMNS